jgi:hypothetical protein
MSGKIQIATTMALAAVIAFGFAAAQNMPVSSPTPSKPAKYLVEVEVVSPGPVSTIIRDADVRLIGPGDEEGPKVSEVDSSGHVRFLNQTGGKYMVWAVAGGFGYGRMDLNVPTQTIDALQGVVSVKMTLRIAEKITCTLPCGGMGELVETTTSTLEDRLVLIPLPLPVEPQIPPTMPHRNRVARFFSDIGHKLVF